MKRIKKNLIICSLVTLTLSSQAFSMGSARPKSVSPKIEKALPLIENLLPLFGTVSPLLGSLGTVLPLLGGLTSQTQTPLPLGSLGNLGTIISTVGTIATTLKPSPKPSAPSNQVGGPYVDQITELAASSSCATYSWKNKGVAPAGYIKGVALSYARSICRLKKAERAPSALAAILGSAVTNNKTNDALSYFKNILGSFNNNLSTKGEAPLRAVYSLGMGLGMQMSGGSNCGASSASVFPVSSSSMGVSSVLSTLLSEYKTSDSGRCFLDVFNEGTNCSANSTTAPAGTNIQSFANSCPAFATEFAMTLLRLNQFSLGSLGTVEVAPACDQLLQNIQSVIDNDPTAACQDIF